MQYTTKPVTVAAYPITDVKADFYSNGSLMLLTQNDDGSTADREYTALMQVEYLPVVGDYWVIPENHPPVVVPAVAFETMYMASATAPGATTATASVTTGETTHG